jgi:hypothetical protein
VRTDRRGGSTLGCLVTVAIIAGAIYLAILAGRPFFRYKQFHAEMENSARWASGTADSVIKARLVGLADSLGLPKAAKKITITRKNDVILIKGKYTETVKFPLIGEKSFEFTPIARDNL